MDGFDAISSSTWISAEEREGIPAVLLLEFEEE
jgi:hypothetical protein